MKKRMLALLVICVLLIGVLSVGAAAKTEPKTYMVGYAIKDMNPWVDPANPDPNNVLDIKLTGNGNDDQRVCIGLMDDNGDGKVDTDDGLFLTCTAITDDAGTTILNITMDTLQGYQKAVDAFRAAIVEKFAEMNIPITADKIMVEGSHTHSGPNLHYVLNGKDEWGETDRADWTAYFNYIVDQATTAAVEAYNDRAPATMTRGSVDAKVATANLGYNNGKGYQMNFIRHYLLTSSKDNVSKSYIGGANFGGGAKRVGAVAGLPGLSGYKVTGSEHTYEADDTMHLLRFTFEDKTKEPIVLVNWRAHPTTNSGVEMTRVSSDYINALRYNLKNAGYRAAFLQGGGGNTVISSYVDDSWTVECASDADRTNVYGAILARVAQYGMKNNMTDALDCGEISTAQFSFHGEIQRDSEGLVAAANAVKEYYATNGKWPSFPYNYTYTDGEKYIINSRFHANIVSTRSTAADGSYNTQEIDVVALGKSALFVTAPNEISDRYDINGYTAWEENDWLELVDEETYGTPFVISHANGSFGYLPNVANYMYNTNEYYELTGTAKDGADYVAAGSYEANTSRYARGVGEKLIQTYKKMIDIVYGAYHRETVCEACGEKVVWQPMFAEHAGNTELGTGHYYLVEDLPVGGRGQNQKMIRDGDVLCLDLNGHTSEIIGRSLYFYAGGTMNLFDSAGGGKIISYSGENNVVGGVASIAKDGTLNVYGGTLQFVRRDVTKNETSSAGVISCGGTVNLYNGTIIGGDMSVSSYYEEPSASKCYGAAITVTNTGVLNVFGGDIVAGSVPEGGVGDCVYAAGKTARVTLSGDANVDEIYFAATPADTLTIKDEFSGSVALKYADSITLSDAMDVGNAVNADLTGSTITCVNDDTYNVGVYTGDLKLNQRNSYTVVTAYGKEGVKNLRALQYALNLESTSCIVVHKGMNVNATIKTDTYLDLNGNKIKGKLTVSDGCTLHVLDSATADLDISDGKYGKIQSVVGNVVGADRNAQGQEVAYMMVSESDGLSFHRVALVIESMTLRSSVAGLYYNSTIRTTPLAEANIDQFGVALSVKSMPEISNLNKDCHRSIFHDFAAAKDSYTGTLLRWVMKSGNSTIENRRNADMPIYGRAYVLTNDGQYLFGEGVSRTFRELVEGVDAIWDTLSDVQKEEVGKLYKANIFVMKSWNVPNIRKTFGADNGDVSFDDLLG